MLIDFSIEIQYDVDVFDARKDQLLTRNLAFHVNSGDMETTLYLFEKMPKSDTFVWNVLIGGLTDNGFFREAIDLYYHMCVLVGFELITLHFCLL